MKVLVQSSLIWNLIECCLALSTVCGVVSAAPRTMRKAEIVEQEADQVDLQATHYGR